ncbi:hypothetical protein GCM10010988_32090 [Cnuibacter physcomitrellae]|nr:hypothetical protein GCM10010988_32090 [Cnuibacter physcomitrellae]
MSVLLPAPFSPTTAWTVPGLTVRSTSTFARTAPKLLHTIRAPMRQRAAAASDPERVLPVVGFMEWVLPEGQFPE